MRHLYLYLPMTVNSKIDTERRALKNYFNTIEKKSW